MKSFLLEVEPLQCADRGRRAEPVRRPVCTVEPLQGRMGSHRPSGRPDRRRQGSLGLSAGSRPCPPRRGGRRFPDSMLVERETATLGEVRRWILIQLPGPVGQGTKPRGAAAGTGAAFGSTCVRTANLCEAPVARRTSPLLAQLGPRLFQLDLKDACESPEGLLLAQDCPLTLVAPRDPGQATKVDGDALRPLTTGEGSTLEQAGAARGHCGGSPRS